MKVKYISDLHLGREYSNSLVLKHIQEHPVDDADVLVIAGDLCTISRLKNFASQEDVLFKFINWCHNNFQKTIIIPGNHEFYDGSELSEFTGYGYLHYLTDKVVIANNSIVKVNDEASSGEDIYFVCSTMWSNVSEQNIPYVNSYMNDTRLIRWHGEKFSADKFQQVHTECREYILQALTNLYRAGVPSCKTVVVTHHCPSTLCENPIHKNSVLSTAFIADDMQNIITIMTPLYWIYGHTHYNKDIDLNDTHIVSNQMGYYSDESSDFSFDKCFYI